MPCKENISSTDEHGHLTGDHNTATQSANLLCRCSICMGNLFTQFLEKRIKTLYGRLILMNFLAGIYAIADGLLLTNTYYELIQFIRRDQGEIGRDQEKIKTGDLVALCLVLVIITLTAFPTFTILNRKFANYVYTHPWCCQNKDTIDLNRWGTLEIPDGLECPTNPQPYNSVYETIQKVLANSKKLNREELEDNQISKLTQLELMQQLQQIIVVIENGKINNQQEIDEFLNKETHGGGGSAIFIHKGSHTATEVPNALSHVEATPDTAIGIGTQLHYILLTTDSAYQNDQQIFDQLTIKSWKSKLFLRTIFPGLAGVSLRIISFSASLFLVSTSQFFMQKNLNDPVFSFFVPVLIGIMAVPSQVALFYDDLKKNIQPAPSPSVKGRVSLAYISTLIFTLANSVLYFWNAVGILPALGLSPCHNHDKHPIECAYLSGPCAALAILNWTVLFFAYIHLVKNSSMFHVDRKQDWEKIREMEKSTTIKCLSGFIALFRSLVIAFKTAEIFLRILGGNKYAAYSLSSLMVIPAATYGQLGLFVADPNQKQGHPDSHYDAENISGRYAAQTST